MTGQSAVMTHLVSTNIDSHTLIRLTGFLLPQSLMTQTNWIHQMCSHQTWWLSLRCVMIVFIDEGLNAFAFLWLKVQDCPSWFFFQLNQLRNRKKRKKRLSGMFLWSVLQEMYTKKRKVLHKQNSKSRRAIYGLPHTLRTCSSTAILLLWLTNRNSTVIYTSHENRKYYHLP